MVGRTGAILVGTALCGLVGVVEARAEQAPLPERSKVGATQQAPVKVDPVALKMRHDQARQLYLLGKQSYLAKKYADALKAFKAAYQLERLPDLLFEMAACQGRMGKMQQAFILHRRYVDSFRDPVKRLVAAARFGNIMKVVRQAAKTKTETMTKLPPSS